MILHLLTDEKFTDYAIAQFSAPEMESEFVLIPSNNMMEQVKLIDRCTVIRQLSPEFEALLNRLDQYSGIMLHGMFWGGWQTSVLERVPNSVNVAWVFWGGDVYSRHELEHQFFAPITGFLYRLHFLKQKSNVNTSWEIPFRLFNHIDYCLTSVEDEFWFAKSYTNSSFQCQWYTYYAIEETVGSLMNSRCEGNNIWLGNSAAVKNNHFDVLWTLRKSGLLRKLNKERVIIPLSYGDPWVRNLVLKVGKLILGKRMQALTKFLPREEYNARMLSCSTLIIGYYEAAGQGNVITGLWLGMRIYFYEQNMTYQFLKRIGTLVYSLETDFNKYGFTKLTQEEREHNKEVLSKWFGKEHVSLAITDIVKKLNTPKK